MAYTNQYPREAYVMVPKTRFRAEFTTPAPPNDSKKRKDPLYELQTILSQGRNIIEANQIIDSKDNNVYVIGLYLVKKFSDEEIVNYYMED
jgi:hypothetical protein